MKSEEILENETKTLLNLFKGLQMWIFRTLHTRKIFRPQKINGYYFVGGKIYIWNIFN